MKKIFTLAASALMASPIYADAITDGISTAGDAVYGYTSFVQALGYVLACVIGIVGAFVIYHAIVNNEPNIRKRILMWGGGCVTMLCMSIALPQFFDYQEGLGGSTLADNGIGNGSGGFGRFVGGDDYGRLIIDIPDLGDPRWRPDPIYDRRIFPPRRPRIIVTD
jgi:hypothetical protein